MPTGIYPRKALDIRFWGKVDKDGPFVEGRSDLGRCWVWTGAKIRGYGVMWMNNHNQPAHRLSYELCVGTISDGLQLDHLCRNHKCVNPSHLEPVTCKVNLERGETLAAANSKKTKCPKGHLYTGVDKRGDRICRICLSDAGRRFVQRQKELSMRIY